MKLSKYIVEAHNEMGHLLTNLYSGSDLFLNNKQYAEYQEILKKLPNNTNSELFDCLRKQLFIVNDEYDEMAIMKLKRKVAAFNMKPTDMKYVIAPTLACNARCLYCYEKEISTKKNNDTFNSNGVN